MAGIESSPSEEESIQQLVQVAIAQPNAALDLLLLNHNCLPLLSLVPNRSCLAIIEVGGENEDSLKALARAKSKLATAVLPQLGQLLTLTQAAPMGQQLPTEGEPIGHFLRKISPEVFQQITKYQMAQISLVDRDVMEAIVGLFIDSGIAHAKNYPQSFDIGEITKELFRLKLIRPEFLASLCHKCGTFRFVVSSYAMEGDTCAFCHERHLFVRIYVLDEAFNRLKSENRDLPLFLKKYIETVSSAVLRVEMSKKIDGGQKGDVDVYVDETRLGIECKVFVHPSVPGTKLDSIAGEIAAQLSNYSDAGVLRALVVTNLTEDDATQLGSKVGGLLLAKKVRFETLKILHRPFENLLKVLNEEIRLGMH